MLFFRQYSSASGLGNSKIYNLLYIFIQIDFFDSAHIESIAKHLYVRGTDSLNVWLLIQSFV